MSTNHTANYSLPQWEGSDAISREEFNSTFSAIDAAIANAGLHLMTGVYTGDGTANRTISLGITPRAVMIWYSGYMQWDSYTMGGVAVTGHSSSGVAITNGGFTVYYKNSIMTNTDTVTYFYIVLY